ncbi:MAG TPA: sugar ABC transporter permease [Ktedonobacteraceae bacterium]|nr:sugar ABC transporter permease [Ktedonobacteraceae bacterium]
MATVARERVVANAPLRKHKGREGISWMALIWIAPAVILLLVFFIYPMINTVQWSFQNADSTQFVGLRNYQRIFTDQNMLEIIKNNLLWLVLATVLTVGLGLIVAVLVDRVKIESIIKSALFVPMAISFVGASIIWRFVYAYAPGDQSQIGLLNAVLGVFNIPPQAWLQNEAINNLALIVIYTWMWTGFSMVIISAALKGIPDDVIEAAKMDGAGRITMFWRITIPMIAPTLGVVTTTMIINILKIFDVVYVETGGNYHTNVVAMEFYNQLFNFGNYGLASALAILLTLCVIPVMVINIRRMRREERGR